LDDAARVLFYGLMAAASPTALFAVLVVLLGRRGRANGFAFAAGFLFGSVAAFLTAFVLVDSTVPDQHHGAFRAYLELALGVLLIAFAWRGRRPDELREERQRVRIEGLFGRLEHVRPTLAFSLGVALGVGTKRLIITVLAASTVAFAGVDKTEEAGLAMVYVLVGGLTVWPPVAVYLIAGRRADDWITDAKAWLTVNAQTVAYYLSAIFGIAIVVDALIELL
jgi:hypothetical protein